MTPIFLDTVGILALLEPSDQWHKSAVKALSTTQMMSRTFTTTSLIFLECGNAVARKPDRARVAEMMREFRTDGTLIIPTSTDVEAAWSDFGNGDAG